MEIQELRKTAKYAAELRREAAIVATLANPDISREEMEKARMVAFCALNRAADSAENDAKVAIRQRRNHALFRAERANRPLKLVKHKLGFRGLKFV